MVDKRQLRRTLERERRCITRRLDKAVQPNPGGLLLGRVNITYALSERTRAVAHGGMGMIARLGTFCGLAIEIDASLHLLKIHHPHHESDHVLNIAYNALCGGGASMTSRLGDKIGCFSTASGPPTPRPIRLGTRAGSTACFPGSKSPVHGDQDGGQATRWWGSGRTCRSSGETMPIAVVASNEAVAEAVAASVQWSEIPTRDA